MPKDASDSPTVTALLIDPVRAEARLVALTVHSERLVLKELYGLIGCELVERAPFDAFHLIYADEDGWEQATGFTTIDGGANAIAGRFLIIGETGDGAPRDVSRNIAPLLAQLLCHRCLFKAEYVTRTGGDAASFVVETRLHSVRPGIDRVRPGLVWS